MLLCPYLRPILKGDPHIVLAVNRHEIHKAVPERRSEFCHQPFLLLQVGEEGFDCRLSGLLAAYLLGDNFQPCLCFIEPRHQPIVAFLVFGLVKDNMSVFVNVLLHEFGHHLHLALQFIALGLQRRGIEYRVLYSCKARNEAVLINNQLVCHRNEKLLDFILSQVRRGTFLVTLEFMIALPDDAAVFMETHINMNAEDG